MRMIEKEVDNKIMNKKLISFFALLVVVLVGCAEKDTTSQKMETEDIKQLVEDYSLGNKNNESASITSHELTVTDSDKKQVIYDLPKDEFFVSIAPYFNNTHT